jgi:hypothetical protein
MRKLSTPAMTDGSFAISGSSAWGDSRLTLRPVSLRSSGQNDGELLDCEVRLRQLHCGGHERSPFSCRINALPWTMV